jgi:hypothetical protein
VTDGKIATGSGPGAIWLVLSSEEQRKRATASRRRFPPLSRDLPSGQKSKRSGSEALDGFMNGRLQFGQNQTEFVRIPRSNDLGAELPNAIIEAARLVRHTLKTFRWTAVTPVMQRFYNIS